MGKELKTNLLDHHSLKNVSDESITEIDDLVSMLNGVRSNDYNARVSGMTRTLHELDWTEGNPTINEVVQSGVIRHQVDFLKMDDVPPLQIQAAKVLRNIVRGGIKGHQGCN
ncbi:hypothetical protein Droror1_Dr00026245 [Drosera rotundifolia]